MAEPGEGTGRLRALRARAGPSCSWCGKTGGRTGAPGAKRPRHELAGEDSARITGSTARGCSGREQCWRPRAQDCAGRKGRGKSARKLEPPFASDAQTPAADAIPVIAGQWGQRPNTGRPARGAERPRADTDPERQPAPGSKQTPRGARPGANGARNELGPCGESPRRTADGGGDAGRGPGAGCSSTSRATPGATKAWRRAEPAAPDRPRPATRSRQDHPCTAGAATTGAGGQGANTVSVASGAAVNQQRGEPARLFSQAGVARPEARAGQAKARSLAAPNKAGTRTGGGSVKKQNAGRGGTRRRPRPAAAHHQRKPVEPRAVRERLGSPPAGGRAAGRSGG